MNWEPVDDSDITGVRHNDFVTDLYHHERHIGYLDQHLTMVLIHGDYRLNPNGQVEILIGGADDFEMGGDLRTA